MRVRCHKRSRQKGSVLVVVLWSLFFLSALAVMINASITPQLNLAANMSDRLSSYYVAKAGLQSVIVSMRQVAAEKEDFGEETSDEAKVLNELWFLDEKKFKDIDVGEVGIFSVGHGLDGEDGSDVYYGLVDEASLFNVNTAPVDALVKFFENVGEIIADDAIIVAQSIIDWRDKDDEVLDNGAENAYYQGVGAGYECKNAEFEAIEELLLVRGITSEIFEKVKNYITVYGVGGVNVNTVGKDVLVGIGASEALADIIISFRKGDDGVRGTKDDHIFSSAGALKSDLDEAGKLNAEYEEQLDAMMELGVLSSATSFFRGNSIGRLNESNFSTKITFVIDQEEQIKYWREE